MLSYIENKLSAILDADIGKLLLRVSLGSLLLFHGVHKLFHGINGVKYLVTTAGLPEFISYGVYIGEIIAPIFLILGLFTRFSAIVFASTMAFAIYLAHSSHLLSVSQKTGGLLIELPLLFLVSALTLAFIGGGRFSLGSSS